MGQKEQWEPFWEHIEKLANKQLKEGSVGVPHFLGVLVHKQLSTPTGEGEARQVVDGQQRLTTLQIVIKALLDLCKEKESKDYEEPFTKLAGTLENLSKNPKSSDPEGHLKVWHKNADREYFKVTMEEGSYKKIREKYKKDKHPIPKCYQYFYLKLRGWLEKAKDDDLEECIRCLHDVISKNLILVVVDLDKGEDANLIFETLNFLGARLSPIDRVKNFLFQQVDDQQQEELYESWRPLDDNRWWRDRKKGSCYIDKFLKHYVTLLCKKKLKEKGDKGDDELFSTFREYCERESHKSVSEHLKQLCNYAQSFYDLFHSEQGTPEAVFLERSDALGTDAPLPIVLKMFHETKDGSKEQKDDFHKALKDMESFLVRYSLCRKSHSNPRANFDGTFLKMIQSPEGGGEFSWRGIREFLKSQKQEWSQEWSSDKVFREVFCNEGAPDAKGMVLWAIADAMEEDRDSAKSEAKAILKGKVTVEHIMPEKWKENWPLPETEQPSDEYLKGRLDKMGELLKKREQLAEDLSELSDQLAPKDALEKRKEAIKQFGNLTLVTQPLNADLSNAGWILKKKKLSEHTKIAMNRDLLEYEDWNEETIRQRGEELFEYALRIWPHPDTPQKP